MAGKKQIDVDLWVARAIAGFEYWEQKIQKTDIIVEMYRTASQRDDDDRDTMSPVVNKVWEYAQSVLPQIFYQSPYAFLTPVRSGEQHQVETLEKVLNHAIQDVPFTKHGRRVTMDALLRGWGVSKVGYLPPAASHLITPMGEEITREEKPIASPSQPQDLNGKAIFRHVPVRDFIIDPDAVDDEDARWCVHRTRESIEDVRRLYKKSGNVPADLADRSSNEVTRMGEFLTGDDLDKGFDLKFVTTYEVWIRDCDGLQKQLLTVMEGHDKWLRFEEWPYQDWPFSVLTFNQDPDQKEPGLSDVAPWAGLQQTLNGYLKREIDFVKNIRVIYLYDSELPEEIVREITSNKDLVLVPCDVKTYDGKVDLRNRVVPVQLANLPAEFWSSKAAVESFIHQVSGYVPFGDREAKAAGTATESNILARSASLRIDDRLVNGSTVWAVDVFTKILGIIQDYYDQGSVPVLKGRQVKEFVEFTEKDLDVEAVVHIDYGTVGRVTSDEQRQRQWVVLMSLLKEYLADPRGVTPATQEMLRRTFNAYHIPDADALLPAKMPISMPGDEHVLMMQGHAVLPHPMDDHVMHLQEHKKAEDEFRMIGNVELAEMIASHAQMHTQLMQTMPAMQGALGEMGAPGGAGTPAGPMGANADGFGSPVATPTSPDQTMGLNIQGGMG